MNQFGPEVADLPAIEEEKKDATLMNEGQQEEKQIAPEAQEEEQKQESWAEEEEKGKDLLADIQVLDLPDHIDREKKQIGIVEEEKVAQPIIDQANLVRQAEQRPENQRVRCRKFCSGKIVFDASFM